MSTALPGPPHLVVMGVAGCGKSTVGALLAAQVGLPFAEGDDFHSVEARSKMSAGIPLTDQDRWPWLDRLAAWISAHAASGSVVACSALRHSYRDRLRATSGLGSGSLSFVHLELEPAVLQARLEQRRDHFMPATLLASQLAILEPLGAGEGLSISAGAEASEVVATIRHRLGW